MPYIEFPRTLEKKKKKKTKQSVFAYQKRRLGRQDGTDSPGHAADTEQRVSQGRGEELRRVHVRRRERHRYAALAAHVQYQREVRPYSCNIHNRGVRLFFNWVMTYYTMRMYV